MTFFFHQLKQILKNIPEENLNDTQYNECIKCIEFYQNAETRNEPFTNSFIVPDKHLNSLNKKDVYKIIWNELEEFLRVNQDKSERHKAIYNHVKKIKTNSIKTTEPLKKFQPAIKNENIEMLVDNEVKSEL